MPGSASVAIRPIGTIASCFQEKFGTPRQPGLVSTATGTIVLSPPFNIPEMVRGLEAYSHIWMIFLFHECAGRPWRPTVRPPRLGGNRRLGVFATRSGFRPNPIGMSVVALKGVHIGADGIHLTVRGVDVISGTPVLDIKPYLPYSDAVVDALAPEKPVTVTVSFTPQADAAVTKLEANGYPGLRELLSDTLAQDPRPAYDARRARRKTYGMRIYDLDVKWTVAAGGIRVTGIVPAPVRERSRRTPC
jgi:tRNA-Thr(GGU) m(6)t(6)A37 methyltransferase TsaA